MRDTRVLVVENIVAGYGDSTILHDVGLEINKNEIVAVIGPNGAGKSTLLKVIAGLLPPRAGSVYFKGSNITDLPAEQIVKRGLVYVPQVENVFPSLTVRENLALMFPSSASRSKIEEGLERTLATFPTLETRLNKSAVLLSGGERQMLALARAMVTTPTIVLLDEPSAGLAPVLVEEVFNYIVAIGKERVSVLLVEQNARKALMVADRGYVLDDGRNRLEGTGTELLDDPNVAKLYLGGSTLN